MKKHRKQVAYMDGQKVLIDVPVDGQLYKMDNRNEYLRKVAKEKHIPLQNVIIADESCDVAQGYEEKQLLICLEKAMQTLTDKERRLINYLYEQNLTEREISSILKISQPAVTKQKHKLIKKLRADLINWIYIP